MVPMLGSTSRTAGAAPRSAEVNKGLLTHASRTVRVPRRKGSWGELMFAEYAFFPRGVGRWTLSGLVCWGKCEKQP